MLCRKRKLITLAAMVLLSMLLSACGQKGPLKDPREPTPETRLS